MNAILDGCRWRQGGGRRSHARALDRAEREPRLAQRDHVAGRRHRLHHAGPAVRQPERVTHFVRDRQADEMPGVERRDRGVRPFVRSGAHPVGHLAVAIQVDEDDRRAGRRVAHHLSAHLPIRRLPQRQDVDQHGGGTGSGGLAGRAPLHRDAGRREQGARGLLGDPKSAGVEAGP
jgi:hypothetical protein